MRWGVSQRPAFIPVALAVLCPLPLLSGPSIDLKTTQIQTLSDKADHILLKVQKTCEDLHLRFIGPTRFVPTWGCVDPVIDIMMITGPTPRLDSVGHSFTFSNADSRLTSYENLLSNDLPENKVLYVKPDQPKWSASLAISIGTAFEKNFLESSDAILGTPTASYEHEIGGHLGEWFISWPRMDTRGHPFYGDHVTIQI